MDSAQQIYATNQTPLSQTFRASLDLLSQWLKKNQYRTHIVLNQHKLGMFQRALLQIINRAAERHFGPLPTKMLYCLKALIVKMKILITALLIKMKIFNDIPL